MSSLPTDRSIRKRLGAWYTPGEIVQPLVRWAIRSPGDLILDPSLGDGHFLVEAARRLRELGSRVPTKQLS
ncbi:MAG: N-6 DNA methylase, partial [Gammaproteobacteria bacterium]